MTDIAITGGGASGIMAAISAKMHNTHITVTVFEKAPKCLKKLLLTGNGRCNILNDNLQAKNFHSDNAKKAFEIVNKLSSREIADFFEKNGLKLSKRFSPLIYPNSFQASAVREMLLTCAYENGVKIFTDCEITKIEPNECGFSLTGKKGQKFSAKKLIICGGTNATIGSASCFSHLSDLGHKINPPYPALTPLCCAETDILKKISGTRAYAAASVFKNGEKIKSDCGEVQFCDYGLSGIVIMQLSGECMKDLKRAKFEISLSFFEDENEVKDMLLKSIGMYKKQTALSALSMVVNTGVAKAALYFSKIDENKAFISVSEAEILNISKNLCDMRFTVTGCRGEKFSQVLGGGASLDMFDENLCSLVNKNLYAAGEVTDVYGDCGGYNLTWAFSGGYTAGKHAALSLAKEN